MLVARRIRTAAKRKIISRKYTTNKKQYDVIIAGGGLVGTSIACGLASSPLTKFLRVALIDNTKQKPLYPLSPVPDLRVYALNHGTVSFLKAIGAWDIIKEARVAPYSDMKVWDQYGTGKLQFSASDVGTLNLGYVVEHHVIQAALNQVLEQYQSSVEIIPDIVDKIEHPEQYHDLLKVRTSDQTLIETQLLIGSDGGNSTVRKSADIPFSGNSYNQRAVVGTVRTNAKNATAWQRFLNTGPIALLPLYDDLSSIVWSTNEQQANYILSLSDSEFAEYVKYAFTNQIPTNPTFTGGMFQPFFGAFNGILNQVNEVADILTGQTPPPRYHQYQHHYHQQHQQQQQQQSQQQQQQQQQQQSQQQSQQQQSQQQQQQWQSYSTTNSVPFGTPFPQITGSVGKRASFPLRMAVAYKYVKPRVALIGDAAHVVHPMAGQGLNLGFGDAAVLTDTLITALESGSDIGALPILQQYEHAQQLKNIPMVYGIDAIANIFSQNDNSAFVLARNFGVSCVNYIHPLKKFFAEQALGYVDVSKIGPNGVLAQPIFPEQHAQHSQQSQSQQSQQTI